MITEIASLSTGVLALLTAIAGGTAAIISALVTVILGKFLVTPFLGARDKQDREVEWRKHAIELTKLDLERKLKSRDPLDKIPLRPSILDFLANYRDLQELGEKTPAVLYSTILEKRISTKAKVADAPSEPY